MKELEKGHDRVQAICEEIRKEALEPAQKEAQRLIDEGERRRQALIAEGEKEKERLINEGVGRIKQERNIYESALEQAVKQSVESLRQIIEKELLAPEIAKVIEEYSSDPVVIANFIEVLIQAIDKEGLRADLDLYVANNVDVDAVVRLLSKKVLSRLKDSALRVGSFAGGVELRLMGDNSFSVSLTDEYLKNLLYNHARGRLRELFFTLK